MLTKAEEMGVIQGIRVARNASSISHLFFFADDCFIFCNAKLKEAREVKNLLEDYCDISGQLINFDKYAVYLSKGAC